MKRDYGYQMILTAPLFILLLVLCEGLYGQEGLGTNAPNPQAVLDIQSPDKGVLLPHISLTASNTFLQGVTATASHVGMLVYNTNTAINTGLVGTGYYFWNGTQWEKFIGDSDLFTDLDNDTQIQVEEGADDDTIRFDTAGAERMVITNTGNVGIGTNAPSEVLDIVGNAEIGTPGEEAHIGDVGGNDWAGFAHKDKADVNNYALIQHTSGITQLNASVGQYVGFRLGNIEKMRLASNGNFGVGTTSPTEKLSIESGDILIGNTDNSLKQLDLTTTGTIDLTNVKEDLILTRHLSTTNQGGGFAGSLIDFRSNNSVQEWTTAQIMGLTHAGSANFSGGLAFATQDGGSTDPDGAGTRTRGGDPQIRMLIQADGDVGIGTTAPTQTLTVSGTAQITGVLYDSSGDAGTSAQVLSSTGTQTNWVTLASNSSIDADSDTQIQVEEGTDDDTIRLDTASVEVATFTVTDTTIANDFTVQGSSSLATTTLGAVLQDYGGDAGTAGQVLSSTGTSTNWVDVLKEAPGVTGIGQLTDGGSLVLDGAISAFIQGDYAYVVSNIDDAFQVIDISTPASPTVVGQLTDDGTLELNGAYGVFAQGNYAYVVSNSDDGFQVIDISNPASPTGVGQLTDDGTLELNGARNVFVQGNYAYVVAYDDDGFQVIDISDPTKPTGVGQLTDGGALELDGAHGVFVQGNYAYVAARADDGFQVIDISDPTNPTGVGQLADSGSLALDEGTDVFVQGKYAYVAAYIDDGLQVIDISDPTNPTGVGQLTDSGTLALDGANSVFIQGNYAYVAGYLDDGLQVIDISDPTNPTGVEQLTDDGSLEMDGAINIFVQGNYAYVAGYVDDGFQLIELGKNRLYGAEVGALAASSLQVDNHALFNNNSDIKGGLSVGASANIDGSLSIGKELIDADGDAGTAGQVLSSTGTSTNWMDSDALQDVPKLTEIGQLTDGGSLALNAPYGFFVQGNYAYVASDVDDGFQVIDISISSSPTGVGQLTDNSTLELNGARSTFAQGNYAYVAAYADDGFQVIDISNPASPTGVGQLTDSGALELDGAHGVFVQGNYAYVTARNDDGFQVIDISDPTNPTGVGQLTDSGALELDGAIDVFVQGNYAYVVGFNDDGFQVIDISDPTNPTGVGQLADSGSLALDGGHSVFVQGNYAYVAAYNDDGLQVIDISDPTNPTGVGKLTDDSTLKLDGAIGVYVQGNYAYVATFNEDAFQVIDISDPTNPTGVEQLADNGSLALDGAVDVVVQGNDAYILAYNEDGFQTIELGTNRLYGLEAGALAASSLQVDNHAQFNNYIDVKGGLSVGASTNIDGSLSVDESALITGAVQLSNYGAGAVQSDANGNLSVSSDERLKNIVGDFERGLTEILALKPITFQWNALSGLEQEGYYSGFSAQNVQGVIPEAVGQDQKGYLTLSDRPIIAAMVNAIKALEAKNKVLEAALEALMKRVEALEAAQR